jgi:hypothetical protein
MESLIPSFAACLFANWTEARHKRSFWCRFGTDQEMSLRDCFGFAEDASVEERHRHPMVNQTTSHGRLQLLQ